MKISNQEKDMLETFCQYGDLANAKLVFVGMEEGLGGNNADIEIRARKELFTNPIFDSNRVFVNGKDHLDGWYINDSTCLIKAQALAKGNLITNLDLIPDYSKSQAMQNQARMHWLLQGTNRSKKYKEFDIENYRHYTNLNKPGSKNAMIDILPFPNQGKLAVEYHNLFPDREHYEKYYYSKGSPRMKVIEHIYDYYPIPLSISYSGYTLRNGFVLKDFFKNKLGFVFENEIIDTSNVNLIDTKINASQKPKNFIIGERKKQDEKVQKVVLTPFWGNGQISRNDIDVISTWL